MKVTAIKQQQKRADRYSIYVDDKYSFSLSENDLVVSGIHKGQELSASDIEKFKRDSEIGKAYDRALNYVAIRARSSHEITTYLQRKQYDEDISLHVLDRLQKLGYINDTAFARQWVEWRSASRSRKQLQVELMQKRVASEIIEQVLSELNPDQESDSLKSIIKRKQHLTQYQDKQKLMAYLLRKGYRYDLVKQTLNEDKD